MKLTLNEGGSGHQDGHRRRNEGCRGSDPEDEIRRGQLRHRRGHGLSRRMCGNGGGQPVSYDTEIVAEKSQGSEGRRYGSPPSTAPENNPYVQKSYEKLLGGKPGSHEAHELVHTAYQSRKRIDNDSASLWWMRLPRNRSTSTSAWEQAASSEAPRTFISGMTELMEN